jgi:HlyD family secretion protein
VVGHTVAKVPLTFEVMGTGTLEARVKTTISPRLQERLAEVLVDQGEAVKLGQLLARLDDGELARQVAVAEAELAAARAMVERVREDEARAGAVALQAQRDHQRVTELQATRVTSVADLDKAAEQLSVAEADLRRARAASREAESAVATAERSLAYHQERLGFTRITAPYDGLIVRRDRDPGGVVVPGSSLLQMISTNELWISAWVDETAMARLATGEVARVVFRSEPNRDFGGQVARLGREADRETREFLVDVRVNELPANWAVGQRAEVYIEAGRIPDALAVPREFIAWRDGRPGIWVLVSGRAEWREVSLGQRARSAVEILRGMSAGEEVIRPRDTAQSLQPGRRVMLVPATTGREP